MTRTATLPRLIDLQLSDQLRAILRMFVGCRGAIHVLAGRGSAAHVYEQPTQRLPSAGLPTWLATELAFVTPDDLRMPLSTCDEGGDGLRDAPLLWAEIALTPEFVRDGWRVQAGHHEAALARLEAFPLPATLLIDQAWSLLAAWRLTTPAPLDSPAGLARVEHVQRALAASVGGRDDSIDVSLGAAQGRARYCSMPAWHPARPVFRLPGSRNFDQGASGAPVVLVAGDVEKRYTLEAFEEALAATTHTAAPRVRRQRQEIV